MDLSKRRQSEFNRKGPRRIGTRHKMLHKKIALLKAAGLTKQQIYETLVQNFDSLDGWWVIVISGTYLKKL